MRPMKSSAFPTAAALLVACQANPMNPEAQVRRDPHSHSEPWRVRVTHFDLDAELDFVSQRLSGEVRLKLAVFDPEAELVLDAEGLDILAVRGPDSRPRDFELGEEHGGVGAPLRIARQPEDMSVTIEYATTQGAEALQWLDAEQTTGGKHPFLFSQGQAILTRTWIPLQDTPGVRTTWSARVRCPEPLTVLMSGESDGRDEEGAFLYHLDRPVPSYLVAIACGQLESRALSDRCAVWAEPDRLEEAAWEFADNETMVKAAEELYGPYLWERYDLLILPPAFPYGGMENPLLTFATPTVIAGDRSLTALVAHELAHSWSGNLVTNATWSDFWLNEGFTVYFEKRIMEHIYGAERANMEMMLELAELRRLLERIEPWKSVLAIDLEGRHPDEGFSSVPYEKGALFLRRLEEVFGRKEFDAFLRSWFDEHQFQSVTTAEFEAFLDERLLSRHPDKATQIDLYEWIHRAGLPQDAPEATSDAMARVDEEYERLLSGVAPAQLDTHNWVTQQWQRFLECARTDPNAERMATLDEAFDFTNFGNFEVLSAWLELSIRADYAPAAERLEEFLMTVGRRKFLQPLYEALMETESGRARAREIYARARPRYHAVSYGTLDGIVWNED